MFVAENPSFCSLRLLARSEGLYRAALPAGVALLLCTLLLPAARAELIGYWDMNDFEDPTVATDRSGKENHGVITSYDEAFGTASWPGVPSYTDDGGGVSGAPGDRAMDFGPVRDGAIINLPTAASGAFNSIIDNDAFTFAFWAFGGDDLPAQTVVFGFYHDPAQFTGDHRMISAHLPWSNSQITYDVGGCCGAENRISQPADETEFKGQWNHYASSRRASARPST